MSGSAMSSRMMSVPRAIMCMVAAMMVDSDFVCVSQCSRLLKGESRHWPRSINVPLTRRLLSPAVALLPLPVLDNVISIRLDDRSLDGGFPSFTTRQLTQLIRLSHMDVILDTMGVWVFLPAFHDPFAFPKLVSLRMRIPARNRGIGLRILNQRMPALTRLEIDNDDVLFDAISGATSCRLECLIVHSSPRRTMPADTEPWLERLSRFARLLPALVELSVDDVDIRSERMRDVGSLAFARLYDLIRLVWALPSLTTLRMTLSDTPTTRALLSAAVELRDDSAAFESLMIRFRPHESEDATPPPPCRIAVPLRLHVSVDRSMLSPLIDEPPLFCNLFSVVFAPRKCVVTIHPLS
jgi:hypothetical protein